LGGNASPIRFRPFSGTFRNGRSVSGNRATAAAAPENICGARYLMIFATKTTPITDENEPGRPPQDVFRGR